MGSGGQRYGAGRPAHKVKSGNCLSIDVRQWHRKGCLRPGWVGGWVWSDAETGEQTSSIGFRADEGGVILNYTMSGTPMRQHVPLTLTRCNFGGTRPWFACPSCLRRVAVLYLRANAGFVCRPCGRIAYSSQSDDEMARAWRQQRKVEGRLGENWRRPKGMHRSTYDKLLNIILDCEERRDAALATYMLKKFPSFLRR